MDVVLLTRRDPARNMARFYLVSIERSLFGDHAVLRCWGRLGTKGHSRLDLYAGAEQAASRMTRLVRAKLKRGYVTG